MACIFCHGIKKKDVLYQTEHFKIVLDIDPIQTGHLLIISKEHVETLLDFPSHIRHELSDLEALLVAKLSDNLNIDGVTLACNNGLFDEGTHFHVHLIPRFKDDNFWENVQPPLHPLNIDKLLQDIK